MPTIVQNSVAHCRLPGEAMTDTCRHHDQRAQPRFGEPRCRLQAVPARSRAWSGWRWCRSWGFEGNRGGKPELALATRSLYPARIPYPEPFDEVQYESNQYESIPRALAIAFATTTIMWLLSYVAMLQPGTVIQELIFIVTPCLYCWPAVRSVRRWIRHVHRLGGQFGVDARSD